MSKRPSAETARGRAFLAVTAVFAFAVAMSGGIASATPLTIGTPDTTEFGNVFPFGSASVTRYQQAYASSNFSGPVTITGINFFTGGFYLGNALNGGTYTLSLSTTPLGVNAINEFENLDANLGADNQLFTISVLSGPVGETLSFSGAAFDYDPSQGDLLLDVLASRERTSGTIGFQEDNFNGGIMSRAHDVGSSFDNRGLVTQFGFDDASLASSTATSVPEPVAFALFGVGLFGLGLVRRRRPT